MRVEGTLRFVCVFPSFSDKVAGKDKIHFVIGRLETLADEGR